MTSWFVRSWPLPRRHSACAGKSRTGEPRDDFVRTGSYGSRFWKRYALQKAFYGDNMLRKFSLVWSFRKSYSLLLCFCTVSVSAQNVTDSVCPSSCLLLFYSQTAVYNIILDILAIHHHHHHQKLQTGSKAQITKSTKIALKNKYCTRNLWWLTLRNESSLPSQVHWLLCPGRSACFLLNNGSLETLLQVSSWHPPDCTPSSTTHIPTCLACVGLTRLIEWQECP